MSIVSTTYNQGTGLLNPVGEGTTLPISVNDLTVEGNLTVLGTSNLVGNTITNDITNTDTITSANIIISNNTILQSGVGSSNTQLFKLPPTNGTTDQILTITDDTVNPIITEWKDVPISVNDYVQYDTTTSKFKRNFNLVISEITNLILDGTIGITGQAFKLPNNTSTTSSGNILSILNASTKTTQWIAAPPTINSYITYNGTSFTMTSNVLGLTQAITNLILDGTIGITGQAFKLPNNTSTTANGRILSILDAATKTTQWISPPPSITDYMSYNGTTFNMSTNVSGTPTIITDIVVSNTVGSAKTQAFKLPANTTTASNGDVLRILNNASVPITTEWANTSTVLPAYVSYNATTTQLSNNPLFGGPSVITDIAVTKIGSTNAQLFSLPNNTSTTTNGQILSILDASTKTTQWITPPTITDYVSFDVGTAKLKNNNLGVANIDYLDLQQIKVNVIGKPNDLFTLPANTTSAGNANTVLKIINGTTKQTSWEPLTTTVSSTGTSIATASAATVEMCRASNLVAGTYIVTYQLELLLGLSARVFSYRSYGIATTVGGLVGNPVLGLVVGDSVPYTAPTMAASNPVRYSGGGVVVLTATTTLYLLTRFVYTGTTFSTTGNLIVTRIA
jgi:hypothetical protein